MRILAIPIIKHEKLTENAKLPANRIQQFYDLCGSDKVDGTGDEAEAE